MCVTMCYFYPNKNGKRLPSSRPYLTKIRDRAYQPTLEFKRRRFTTEDGEQGEAMYVTDQNTNWSEGLNSFGVSIISSALQSHDSVEGTSKDKSKSKDQPSNPSRNGVIIRQALKHKTLQEVVDYLVDARFEGCTFVADDKNVQILEIFLPESVKEKYSKEVIAQYYKEDYNEIEHEEDVLRRVNRLISPEDYDVNVFEPEEDAWYVRTNNGIDLNDAGYTKEDGDGYISSVKRREYTMEALKTVEHPFDLIEVISNLHGPKVDKNPFYCPIRLKEKGLDIFTTAVFLHMGNTIFCRPFASKIADVNINKIADEKRETNFVVLPKGIKNI